jgi:hypothetical protein
MVAWLDWVYVYPNNFYWVLMMPRRSKSAVSGSADLAAIVPVAVKLSQPDRLELIAILQALQEAEAMGQEQGGDPCGICEAARERTKEEALNRRGIRGGIGSFEDKIINGCGPYRYLRYWYGKTHKSIYLGRVE